MFILTSDHAGYYLKEKIKNYLDKNNIPFIDAGPSKSSAVDYPDYATAASKLVLEEEKNLGLFICGTGIGMSIAANKVKGIRAANVTDYKRAALAIEHNKANVITIGGRFTSFKKAKKIIKTLLQAKFEEGRHIPRLEKIKKLEC